MGINWTSGPIPPQLRFEEIGGMSDGGYYLTYIDKQGHVVIAFERDGVIGGWAYLTPPAPVFRESFTMEAHATV